MKKSSVQISQKLIDEFLNYLRLVENKSEHTLSSYERDLNKFYNHQSQKSPLLFAEYLKKQKLNSRSQARAMSAVRSYSRFLENKGYQVDFRSQFKISGIKNALPLFVNYNEFNRILKEAELPQKEAHTQRNHLVLYLFFSLGCRVSELVSLQVADFIDTDESIIIRGKGNKQRILPVVSPLLDLMRDYLSHARPQLIRSYKTHSLILNDRGNKPSRVDIWRWIKKWSRGAGCAKYPHQLRHGCATELLDHGADLRSIQELLGHSSIETTKIYTKVTRHKIRNTIKKHHPLS